MYRDPLTGPIADAALVMTAS